MPNITLHPNFIYNGHVSDAFQAKNLLGVPDQRRTHDGYSILLGLLPPSPGSLPQHLAWVHFPTIKAIESFLQAQNSIDFTVPKSNTFAEKTTQSKSKPSQTSRPNKATNGGSIFEILNEYGGNIEAYRKAKDAKNKEEEYNNQKQELSYMTKKATPTAQVAFETNIPYKAFRATKLLPRLVAITEGERFLETIADAKVEEYSSTDGYTMAFIQKFTSDDSMSATKKMNKTMKNNIVK